MDKMFKWGRTSSVDRETYCSTFSPVNWVKLNNSKKKSHDILCDECPKLTNHGMSPSSANFYKAERKVSPGYSVKEAKKSLKRKSIKEATSETLQIMNKSFGKTYGMSFEESLLQNNSTLTKKPTYEETRNIKKIFYRDSKQKMKMNMN